jgi:hypothetical protein
MAWLRSLLPSNKQRSAPIPDDSHQDEFLRNTPDVGNSYILTSQLPGPRVISAWARNTPPSLRLRSAANSTASPREHLLVSTARQANGRVRGPDGPGPELPREGIRCPNENALPSPTSDDPKIRAHRAWQLALRLANSDFPAHECLNRDVIRFSAAHLLC